jgi:ribonuclease BN (tRNA processing enzyme)
MTDPSPRPDRIVLLGVKGGPAIRARGAMPTATLVDMAGRRIVVDCGLGVAKGLVEAGADLRTIDHVLITHLHSDHVLELGPLLHTAWTTGLAQRITVWGPPGIDAYWAGFLASMAYDIDIRVADEGRTPLADLIDLRIYGEGQVMDDPGLRITALRVPHPPLADCFAMRIDGRVSVTLSGDTAYFPPLADFARDCAVLLHEAMLPEGIETIITKTGLGDRLRKHLWASHSTVEQAAMIARDAGVGRLVLNHLIPVDDPAFTDADWMARATRIWNGPVTVGRDGMEIAL